MTVAMIVLWALVGWCGTPWPRPWPFPDPPPTPDPWIAKVVGVVGGVVGGIAYSQIWPAGGVGTNGVVVAATAIGAFVGSVFLVNMYGLVRGRPKAQSLP
jgi:hypothetical protein